MITVVNKPKKIKYNVLFLPGMPGKQKELALFKDITETGGQIHWLTYPGTYAAIDQGKFSIQTATQAAVDAVKELGSKELPFILIGYSFGTLLIPSIKLAAYANLLSVMLFSPIRGLDSRSIDEDFLAVLEGLKKTDLVTIDATDQEAIIRAPEDYSKTLDYLVATGKPIVYNYSAQDRVVKPDDLRSLLANYQHNHRQNCFLVYESVVGDHRLDTYYSQETGNYFRAIEIYLDLTVILGTDIAAYLWGSSQYAHYANDFSDIDMLVFADDYLKHYRKLNSFVKTYNDTHDIAFDLSINDKKDLKSLGIYRYNRGQIITNELIYNYFPIKKIDFEPLLNDNDLQTDCYRASQILLNESKKILCKCDASSKRSMKVIKYAVFVFTYLLYVSGLKNLDLNNLEGYADLRPDVSETIRRCLLLKKNNYLDMSLEDMYEAVLVMEKMVSEQEAAATKAQG